MHVFFLARSHPTGPSRTQLVFCLQPVFYPCFFWLYLLLCRKTIQSVIFVRWGSWGRNSGSNGESACEGQGFNPGQCQAVGCCQWDEGQVETGGKDFLEEVFIFIFSAGQQLETGLVAVKLEDLEVKLTHPPLPLHQQVQHSFHMQKRKSYMHASFQQQQK